MILPITITSSAQFGSQSWELGWVTNVDGNYEVEMEDDWDIIAPIPSCVLMFKKELPLLFAEDNDVQKVKNAFYDPFEFLMVLKKNGKLNTDFTESLGEIAYHVPCHQRVQNIGPKTKEVLGLIPNTNISVIERCSGHDGTYAVKTEYHETSMKICRPIINKIEQSKILKKMKEKNLKI